MKAVVTNWSVEEQGPAFETRREHRDRRGRVTGASYEGRWKVSMTFDVVGNDATEFLRNIKVGMPIKELDFGAVPNESTAKGRKYVFTE